MVATHNSEVMAVVSDPNDFDEQSGNFLERLIFNHRIWVIVGCILLTGLFAIQMRGLVVSASYDKMLPYTHPYIQNFLENRGDLRGLGDSIRVVVENTDGDIFDPVYLDALAKINDEIFLLPGVDRAWMKSIFTPVVRWTEVTEEGFVGGPVLPNTFNGSPKSIEELRINIERAGVVGSLVANDYKSSMIAIPLLATDAEGKAIDYSTLSSSLEAIRDKYGKAGPDGKSKIRLHIIGFAKLVGDLIDGLVKVMYFFLAAAVVACFIIFSIHPLCSQYVSCGRLFIDCSCLATRHGGAVGARY